MRRREFITLLFGAAVAGPFAARAEPQEQMRLIGVLMGYAESDSEGQAQIAAFKDELKKLGWMEDHNARIETRWATPTDAAAMKRSAKELVALQPNVILSSTTHKPHCCNKRAPSPWFSEGGMMAAGLSEPRPAGRQCNRFYYCGRVSGWQVS